MRVNRTATDLWSAALGAAGTVIRYGHWGRPVLVFPSERGGAADFENHGMVGAVEGLIDAGRMKLYCVDSYDAASWSNHGDPARGAGPPARPVRVVDRRRRRAVDLPGLRRRSRGDHPAAAAWARSTRPTSRSSGPTCSRWPCASPATTTPPRGTAGASGATRRTSTTRWTTSANLAGDHLDWLRGQLSLLLVCGQGQWEDTTGALSSTRRFAALLLQKGIRHELDLWGHDVPHDWPSWRAQLAHHLPRFC